MHLVVRADASSKIGFGHLARTIPIALAARRAGVDVRFVVARGEGIAEAAIERRGLQPHVVAAPIGSDEDALLTRALAGEDACILADGYSFDSRWLRQLRGENRIVACVDDLARERFDCDVVINANVSGRRMNYQVSPQTRLLAGPEYTVVDDRFVRARQQKQWSASCERLLITMGGSDPPGATLCALEALNLVRSPRLRVRVVVGIANQRRAEIAAAALACTAHALELRVGVEDMAEEMLWADLVVTASGVTSSELSCVGVPGVAVAIVDNQRANAAELDRRGLFEVVELEAGAPAIAEALSGLIADRAKRRAEVDAQRDLVDGCGKERLVAQLLAICERSRHTPRQNQGGHRG